MRFVTCTPHTSAKRLNWNLDDVFRGFLANRQENTGSYPVHMELTESDQDYRIFADLPGMEKEKIKIMVEKDILTISGERARGNAEDSKKIFSERFYGSFSRSFRLPENVEKSGVSADYKNGILEVSIPKKEETKPKEIEVKVS